MTWYSLSPRNHVPPAQSPNDIEANSPGPSSQAPGASDEHSPLIPGGNSAPENPSRPVKPISTLAWFGSRQFREKVAYDLLFATLGSAKIYGNFWVAKKIVRHIPVVAPAVQNHVMQYLPGLNANDLGWYAKNAEIAYALATDPIVRQFAKHAATSSLKMGARITDILKNFQPPTPQEKARMMAEQERKKAQVFEAAHPEWAHKFPKLRERYAQLDLAMDSYFLMSEKTAKPEKAGKDKADKAEKSAGNSDLAAFEKFLHNLASRKAIRMISFETKDISYCGKPPEDPEALKNFRNEQKKLDDIQLDLEARAEEEFIEGKLPFSLHLTSWRNSTSRPDDWKVNDDWKKIEDLKEISPLIITGETDLLHETCKAYKKTEGEITLMDLMEISGYPPNKDARPRLVQKTSDPKLLLGPFYARVESGDAATPLSITNVNLNNATDVKFLIWFLGEKKDGNKECNKFSIYHPDVSGFAFDMDLGTAIHIYADGPATDPKLVKLLQEKVPQLVHLTAKPPSKEKRYQKLGAALEKEISKLDQRDLTAPQREGICATIRQDKHKDLIVKKSVEHKASIKIMNAVIADIFWHIESEYRTLKFPESAAEQGQAIAAEGNAESNLDDAFKKAKEEIDNKLEKFITQCFEVRFKKVEAKATKDKENDKKIASSPDVTKAGDLSPNLDLRLLQRAYPVSPTAWTDKLENGQKPLYGYGFTTQTIGNRLHYGADCGDLDIIKKELTISLHHQSDINTPNNKGNTALHLAAKNGHLDAVNALLADVRIQWRPNDNADTPLHLAAQNGHIDVVRALLDESVRLKIDINMKNASGNTALDVALAATDITDAVKLALVVLLRDQAGPQLGL